jgi:hypothetical protein
MKNILLCHCALGGLLALPAYLHAQNVFRPIEIAQTYLISEVDTKPSSIHQEGPKFSNDALATKGFVRLAFIISADGTISGARVTVSSDKALEAPVFEAVGNWR